MVFGIQSQNFESISVLVLQFVLERNIDIAAQDVRDKVNAALSKLPSEIDTPIVQKPDLQAQALIQLALTGPLPLETLTKAAEDELRPSAETDRWGGYGGHHRRQAIAAALPPGVQHDYEGQQRYLGESMASFRSACLWE